MASNDVQSQISALKDEIAKLQQDLADRAGDAMEAAAPAVRSAGKYVKSEGAAIASAAREHPAALSTVVLAAGFAGIAIGYMLGTLEDTSRRSRWY